MQFLKDLPQTTQLSIALVLVLLPVLAAIVLSKKKTAAATPADAASRKERRRRGARTATKKTPRRQRRNLADETAQQIGVANGVDTDVDLIITPEDAEAPEGVTLASDVAPPPAPENDVDSVPVSTEMPVSEISPTTDDEREPETVAIAVVDDPYVTVAPAPAVGPSVAQPGWPSPGELASGFDPDAFDPLPPAAPHAHHDEDIAIDVDLTDIDSGEAWLDENLTASQEPLALETETDREDTQIIQVPTADWDEDDDFDPATGWSDDGSDLTPHVAIEGDEQPEWVVPAAESVEIDDEIAADDVPVEALTIDEQDEPITVTVSTAEEADEITDWDEDDEPLTSVAWDTPESDERLDDDDPTTEEPVATATDAWQEDGDVDDEDETWADTGWSDDDPQELAMSTPLAVPFPPPGTLPAHEQVATLAVPFPTPGTLPAHEDTVSVFAEADDRPAAEFSFSDTTPQMPAITGRLDTGSATPVVIDLASLVAHGERVEMVIEQDPSGTGVRLRFGPSVAGPEAAVAPEVSEAAPESADTPEAVVEATLEVEPAPAADSEPEAETATATNPEINIIAPLPAPSQPEQSLVDIPFLTGGPRSASPEAVLDVVPAPPEAEDVAQPAEPVDVVQVYAPEAAPIQPADVEPDRPSDAAPEPIAPATLGVASTSEDDPGKILADIRARLAALDQRRGDDDTDI